MKTKCITFNQEAQNSLPEHIKAKMKADREVARKRQVCPEFPYWGAKYPDARCVNGKLYDLDRCDENGNLYEPMDDIPCPFCQPEEFIECDPFGKEDEFYEGIENEEKAKEKSREWYLQWINGMKKRYG